jgi:hypothetical protein
VFSKWLALAIPNVMKLGHQVSDYGTHSFRKGIATFTAGFIGGVPRSRFPGCVCHSSDVYRVVMCIHIFGLESRL